MEFKQLSETRRSIRAYDGTKSVTREQVEEIIASAIEAPSWKNSQTARFYCAVGEKAAERLRDECLPSFNAHNTVGAAYIVTAFVKDVSGFDVPNGKPANEIGNGWGYYDLGLSSMLLTLKAKEMGLGTLIMGIRDADKIRDFLGIPENELITAVIAVGYPAVDPRHTKREPVETVAKFF